jgi:nitrogen-specific signal transduction histidine kinase
MSPFAGLDFLGTGVVVLDADLRVIYVNAAGEQLFELAAKTLAGQRFPDCCVIQ